MTLANIIVVLILIAVIGGAVVHIYKEKKRGVKCIGCSDSGNCSGCHQAK